MPKEPKTSKITNKRPDAPRRPTNIGFRRALLQRYIQESDDFSDDEEDKMRYPLAPRKPGPRSRIVMGQTYHSRRRLFVPE